MIRWDAARYRQQQTPRRYRACGPVGEKPVERGQASMCRGCGFHVCSCPPTRIPEPVLGNAVPRTLAGRLALYEALKPFSASTRAAVTRLIENDVNGCEPEVGP